MLSFFSRFCLAIACLILVNTAYAQIVSPVVYRNFWQPYYHGERLNYCTPEGICGLKVATWYCQKMGFERADQQMIANNVGLTRILSKPGRCPVNLQCQGWRCNSFKTIRCVKRNTHQPPQYYHYRKRRFVLPRYNNYRVAFCYDAVKGCGGRAAHSFCRRLGYRRAIAYKKQDAVPATQAIANQKLCFGPDCKGFAEIDCYR